MHPSQLVPLFACLAAVGLAAGILVRDPGQRANRLVALILVCSAHWSLCEVIWSQADDAETVILLVKLSSLGWVPLGALCFHVYLEIVGDVRTPLRRLLPFAYGSAVSSILVYATPWCLGPPVRTDFGWGVTFGPLFLLAYVPTIAWVSVSLAALVRFFRANVSRGERRQATWLVAGIVVPVLITSLTDVLLPAMGRHVPRLGSASVVVLGAVVAWSVSRYGYFLLAPGAFTREILETLRDAVVLVDPDGRIGAGNAALERLTGRGFETLCGGTLRELLPELPAPEGAVRSEFATRLRTPSGESLPVSVASAALRGEEGEPVGWVLAIRDLREVEALRGRLVTSGRLAAVGELAAGIAHEINNPITFIRSNLELLHQHWASLAEAAAKSPEAASLAAVIAEGEELIEESAEGVDRVAAIVKEVGAFSHAGLGEAVAVDVNELLENAVNVAALSFKGTVERCYTDLPPLRCSPQQLKQVFLNLLLNALQAVRPDGHIRLVTLRAGDAVGVRVEDDGCGIPADALERVFDPFFTTRPAGEGMGLGLAHCFQIVRAHGGEISARSEPGRGTVFEILLPFTGPSAD